MKWLEVKIDFLHDNINFAREEILKIFAKFGITELALMEPISENPLDFYHDDKNIFMNDYAVSGYFLNNRYARKKKEMFLEEANLLEGKDIIYNIEFIELLDTEWENSWKKYFRPEKITETLVVKPTWQEYEKKENEEIIEIDPGMAFGTGTHPTTYLCMNMIEKYKENINTLLDVGTGSGILMMAGAKLGIETLYGIDIDEEAINVAKRNLELNKIENSRYKLFTGDLLDKLSGQKFDMVVSNILAEVIIILLKNITEVIKKGGIFISSGILSEKSKIVEDKMIECGLKIVEKIEKDGWVSLVGRY